MNRCKRTSHGWASSDEDEDIETSDDGSKEVSNDSSDNENADRIATRSKKRRNLGFEPKLHNPLTGEDMSVNEYTKFRQARRTNFSKKINQGKQRTSSVMDSSGPSESKKHSACDTDDTELETENQPNAHPKPCNKCTKTASNVGDSMVQEIGMTDETREQHSISKGTREAATGTSTNMGTIVKGIAESSTNELTQAPMVEDTGMTQLHCDARPMGDGTGSDRSSGMGCHRPY